MKSAVGLGGACCGPERFPEARWFAWIGDVEGHRVGLQKAIAGDDTALDSR